MNDLSVEEENMDHDNEYQWNLFCDALKCPRNELYLMCHRNPEEVVNPSKWPKIIDASRDDVQPDFGCFMSDFQIQALAQSTCIGIDNNQSCPWFTCHRLISWYLSLSLTFYYWQFHRLYHFEISSG